MMKIESNANEEAIAKWTAELDEKLGKLKQPMTDIEEAPKNWKRRKAIKEKNKRIKYSREEFEKKITIMKFKLL